MSRTRRSNIRQSRRNSARNPALRLVEHRTREPMPLDHWLDAAQTRQTLDAVLRAHRWQLVSTARHHLRHARADAEDLVQEVCVEALDGELALSPDPSDALGELLAEVVRRCRGL